MTAAQPKEHADSRFRALVRAHIAFVWRCLRRLGVPEADCDDATQQVLCIAASKLPTIDVGTEKAFLFATAARVAANARRALHRRDRVQRQLSEAAVDPPAAPTPEDLASQHRARVLMDAVLDEMSEELRTVFVLFELEEMPLADIAAFCRLPIGTVSSRLRRARQQFSERVNRMKAARLFEEHGRLQRT